MNGYHLDRSQIDNVWVIGNGESRNNVNLKSLSGMTIGCNAIHRDHVCDKIVAVDRRMVMEIIENPSYKSIPVYTRPNWIDHFKKIPNITVVPELPYKGDQRWDDPWHWNSGPFAVLLACLENPKTINLLGFDLYGSDSKVNNVYKNTKNYDNSDRHAVDYSHWLHQLEKLFNCFPNIEFIQWQQENWQMPEKWINSKNLTFRTINV